MQWPWLQPYTRSSIFKCLTIAMETALIRRENAQVLLVTHKEASSLGWPPSRIRKTIGLLAGDRDCVIRGEPPLKTGLVTTPSGLRTQMEEPTRLALA
jgi:hypothetical protein